MKIALCISGYFGSTSDPFSDGAKGFEYIKREILDKYSVDVFIHSWDLTRGSEIRDAYSPWLRSIELEPQKDFKEEQEKIKGDWTGAPCSKFNFLSQAYGRKKSLELKDRYEEEYDFVYDWVIYCRFDLGLRDLRTADPRYRCCEIDFDPSYDSSLIYTKYWPQFNQGFADMWVYANSENMDTYAKYYDDIFTHMQPGSAYLTDMTSGWFDSSAKEEFSNEMFKEDKCKEKRAFPYHWCLGNNHSLHKWFFKKRGLYDKCKEGALVCRTK